MRSQPEYWSSLRLTRKIYFALGTCSYSDSPKMSPSNSKWVSFFSTAFTWNQTRQLIAETMHSLTTVSMSLSVLPHESASIFPFSVSQLFDANISHNGCSTFNLVLETSVTGAVIFVLHTWLTRNTVMDGSEQLYQGFPVKEFAQEVIALHSCGLIDLLFVVFSCVIVFLHSRNRVAKE